MNVNHNISWRVCDRSLEEMEEDGEEIEQRNGSGNKDHDKVEQGQVLRKSTRQKKEPTWLKDYKQG